MRIVYLKFNWIIYFICGILIIISWTVFVIYRILKFNGAQKFYSLRLSFDKALDFLKDSMSDKLLQNKAKFKDIENPKISVVISIYNCEKFIYRAIRSIQNQNILELEIVLVNDHSPDNTLSIL